MLRQGAPTLSPKQSSSEPRLAAEYQIVSATGGPGELAKWLATVPMPDHLAPGPGSWLSSDDGAQLGTLPDPRAGVQSLRSP